MENLITCIILRLVQYIGGYKNVYIAPTQCFMLLDGAAIFRETTECRLNKLNSYKLTGHNSYVLATKKLVGVGEEEMTGLR
mgnify:CR=1 FL=1